MPCLRHALLVVLRTSARPRSSLTGSLISKPAQLALYPPFIGLHASYDDLFSVKAICGPADTEVSAEVSAGDAAKDGSRS